MPDSPTLLAPLAWLATYLVHSTLLLGVVFLLSRQGLLSKRGLRARTAEWSWKLALVGGLATATLQTSLGFDPLGGRIEFGGASAPTMTAAPVGVPAAPAPVLGVDVAALPRPAAEAWPAVALWGWVVGGALGALVLLVATRRLQVRLRGIVDVEDPELLARLEHLRRRAGMRRRVRLATCDRLDSPIALGVLRPTIVLPTRALRDLSPRLQTPMLAHEVAHVARLDPLWLELCRVLECVLFVQPLHRVARRQLARCAEFRCDDWAARESGDRVGLARCLTEVAGWIGRASEPLPACGMADLRSPLAERVQRILDTSPGPDARPTRALAVAPAMFLATVLYAPGFAVADDDADRLDALRERLSAENAVVRAEVSTTRGLLDALHQEVDALHATIDVLREDAALREVPAATLAELEALTARIRQLQDQHDLLAALTAQLEGLRADLPDASR